MNFIRAFFAVNRDVVAFGYGLVFFVLGLGVALQSRRYSRLDLAKSLSWLAAFGLTYGAYEWGDLFIPIQAAVLDPGTVALLEYAHLLLLGVSFACLMAFGVALLRPFGRARGWHVAPAALLAAWIFLVFFPLRDTWRLTPDIWHAIANTLARYFIAFPGALLAAYGLRRQTFERIAPLNVPHIVRMLRAAGVGLALYAVFGGLIPPAAPFFPANVVNAEGFEAALGVPVAVFRSLVGLVMAVTFIRALEIFEVETGRIIEHMEQQQILTAEHERIGRALHDGAIQKVYSAGLLVETAQYLVSAESPAADTLGKAVSVLRDAITDLRHNLGELRATASGEPLAEALRRLADDPRTRSLVDVSLELDLPPDDWLTPIRTDHVLAVVNEALANVVRHARARQVKIAARQANGRLLVAIQDDGQGLPADLQAGYGLRNMRDRARLLGGSLTIESNNARGTVVTLDVPWRDER